MISVIIPTVEGREDQLRDCLASYAAHTTDYEMIVIVNDGHPCGHGWVEGAQVAVGEYIHFSADDLQPHAGWAEAAKATASLGVLPAPRILTAAGELETCGGEDGFEERPTGYRTDFTRIPFLTREQWATISPRIESFLRTAHYFTDNAISWAGHHAGIPTAVDRGYLFTHHWAQAGRGAGMSENDRMLHDFGSFRQLVTS